jgi:signal transduction histidine kinase
MKRATIGPTGFEVDERDHANRIILNPITDETSHVVGVAGMILDEDFLRTEILPAAVSKSLPTFFPDQDRQEMVVSVTDPAGNAIYSTGYCPTPKLDVARALPLVFTDFRLGLTSGQMTPEQWARSNFQLNMTLSALLAVVLLGGLILALRSASRAVKLSTMKSEFVSNVSHELRTPLASIRVFSEFMKLGRVSSEEKVREYGEYIEAESRRLTALVDNILDFSRIESGRKQYRFELTDLRDLLRDTLKVFEVRLRHQGFSLRFDCAEEALPAARMDSEAIGQAVSNLIDNAVKYSNGSKEIEVKLARSNGWLEVSVTDHGVGISRDEQKKIFERFHRVSTGLIHDVKGSGLGLSIVHHVVKAHDGAIDVTSEPGRGSTFTMRLPVATPPAAEARLEGAAS